MEFVFVYSKQNSCRSHNRAPVNWNYVLDLGCVNRIIICGTFLGNCILQLLSFAKKQIKYKRIQPHLFTTFSQKSNKGSAVGSSKNLGDPLVMYFLFLLLFSFTYVKNVWGPWSPLGWPLLATALKNVLGFI